LLAALVTSGVAQAATVEGRLDDPGVVWISDGSAPAPSDQPAMHQLNHAFLPALMVVTAGSNVLFPNDDAYLHSVYSVSGPDPFDIGFYTKGPGKLVSFPRAGAVIVGCHIHPSMHATIIIVNGPWAQTSAGGESFRLENVRPGAHALHVWTPEGGERTSPIRIGSVEARLVLNRAL
jgi:plastocyanin